MTHQFSLQASRVNDVAWRCSCGQGEQHFPDQFEAAQAAMEHTQQCFPTRASDR